MKKKNIILLSAVSCLSLVALVSCGGGQTKKAKFEISISGPSNNAEKNMLNLWKQEYEKLNPKVTVKVDSWGSEEGSSQSYIMKHALNRDYLTNIVYTTDDTTAYLAELKNFVDLRKFYEADPETDYTKYYTNMLDLASFYGEFRPTESYTGSYQCEKSNDAQYGLYFAPREYNMPAIVVNETLVKKYLASADELNNWGKDSVKKVFLRIGESTEWNWNCFIKVLHHISDFLYQKLDVEKDTTFYGYRGIELLQTWEPIYTSIMKEHGGDGLFATDERGETAVNMNSTKNRGAYDKIVNDFGKSDKKYMIDTDYKTINFSTGNIFMVCASFPEVGNYYETFKKIGSEIAFLPIPCEYVGAGCGGYGILVDKANVVQTLTTGETAKTGELCWDFIKFILSKNGQNICGKEGYIQPVLKELSTTGDWLKSYDENLDHSAFCHGKELKLDTFTFAQPRLREGLRTEVSSFFRVLFENNTKSYEAILSETIDSINNVLKS